MNKDKKEIKPKCRYEFRSGEYNKKETKISTTSKLKCGNAGIECLIKK